jgi:hypothetical protein
MKSTQSNLGRMVMMEQEYDLIIKNYTWELLKEK